MNSDIQSIFVFIKNRIATCIVELYNDINLHK